jgi:hypothetical protein
LISFANVAVSDQLSGDPLDTDRLVLQEGLARQSWWPQRGAWARSGLNTGWWSPVCEHWFKKTLRNMEEDAKRPIWTNGQWKKHIKFFSQSNKIFEANEKLAAEYILRCS